MKNKLHILVHIILIIIVISQIILTFLLYNENGIFILRYLGFILWILSAIFGWLPIYTFKKIGGVKKGESFIRTNRLVDKGIYSIVRHPQFVGGIMFSLALIIISQNLIVLILAVISILIWYAAVLEGDKEGIKKFGEEYKKYMKRVPRMNFVLGLIRLMKNE